MHPCLHCKGSDSICEFRADDQRRRPVSREYVAALEERLAAYESAGDGCAGDAPQNAPFQPLIFDYEGSSRRSTLTMRNDASGEPSSTPLRNALINMLILGPHVFYGPTGIYPAQSTEDAASQEAVTIDEERADADSAGQVASPDMINLDKHFFERSPLYAFLERVNLQCPFIYPDSLFNPLSKHKSASALVHVMNALGGAVSGIATLANQAYNTGDQLLGDLDLKFFSEPNSTSLKLLLCLSFLQLGKGNNSSGWMLSGRKTSTNTVSITISH